MDHGRQQRSTDELTDEATPSDHTERFRTLSATASFNQWAGFEVLRVVDNECDLRMHWRDDGMGQYSNFLHAGLIGALLDTACGFAAASTVGGVLASQFSVNCLAPAVGDEFIALGRVVKLGRKQIFTAGELHAYRGDASKLVATATTILVPTE